MCKDCPAGYMAPSMGQILCVLPPAPSPPPSEDAAEDHGGDAFTDCAGDAAEDALLSEYEASAVGLKKFAAAKDMPVSTMKGLFQHVRKRRETRIGDGSAGTEDGGESGGGQQLTPG